MMTGKRGQEFKLDDKNKRLVFVYATLMDPRSRDLVLGHKDKIEKAILPSFKRVPYKTPEGKNFNTIQHAGMGDEVKGDVFEAGPEDFQKLVNWEDQYSPIVITLKDGRQAHAFVLNKKDELKKE